MIPPASLWRQIPRLALYGLGLIALLVILHVLYMVVYGYIINPGQTPAHYPAHAAASGPWFSIIVGTPLFFLVALRLGRRHGSDGFSQAMLLTALYVAIDVGMVVAAGSSFFHPVFIVAMASKFAAAYAGARTGMRRGPAA